MSEEYSGKEGRFISHSNSRKWVANFQENNPGHTHAFYFGRELFENILNEPGCVGIRVYYAQDDAGNPKMVLMGVDNKGNNILKKQIKVPRELRSSNDSRESSASSADRSGGPVYMGASGGEDDDSDSGIFDNGKPCPPYCGGGGVGFP